MLRILSYLIIVFALGLGFAWLAERPGTMLITFNGYEYQVTLMVAAVLVTALVALVMLTWWVLKSIWASPYTVSRYFRVRRRDRGYQALSSGLIAAGAGDAEAARRLHKQAAKMLNADQEPLVHLLEAQAALLEGDHPGARARFERMLDDPEMRLIGLRGLFLEAERIGDRNVARHYAERAIAIAPQLAWASGAALEARMRDGDWDAALRILDAQKASRQIERETLAREKAVLLTAKAMSLMSTDPLAARNAAIEANRLDPALEPAAVAAAKALFKNDDLRKGSKVLEAAWKRSPHPEIAQVYIHARPGDSAADRLKRARRLEELQPASAESFLAVARAALEADDLDLARRSAEQAARMSPRESAHLLLADIEEAQTGDIGRVREHLARAVRSPRDPAWTADGHVSDRWAPFSPITGRIGAFEWRAPVERIGQTIDQAPRVVVAPVSAPVVQPAPVAEEVVEPVVEDVPAAANDPRPTEPEPTAEPIRAAAATSPTPDAVAALIPDDPGVSPEEADERAQKRFRLF